MNGPAATTGRFLGQRNAAVAASIMQLTINQLVGNQ